MAKNTSVALGEHFEAFVRKQVKSGRYASASEVLRDGLRLLEQEIVQREALRKALVVGEQSGVPTSYDNIAFKKQMHKKYMRRNA